MCTDNRRVSDRVAGYSIADCSLAGIARSQIGRRQIAVHVNVNVNVNVNVR